jgi:hypothetical protein
MLIDSLDERRQRILVISPRSLSRPLHQLFSLLIEAQLDLDLDKLHGNYIGKSIPSTLGTTKRSRT